MPTPIDQRDSRPRMIDGKLCLMKSGSVKTLSRLFTGKITKSISAAD